MPDNARPHFDPNAVHEEIEHLSRRLHDLVDDAASVVLERAENTITLSREAYEHLLRLAGGSPDLAGRAAVSFDDLPRAVSDLKEDFRQQILDDLAEREDLDYRTFCRVLDDVEECDGAEVPSYVAPAMLRAWVRSGDLSDTRRWRGRYTWDRVASEDAQRALDAAVELGVLGRLALGIRGDDLAFWIGTVAPQALPDGAERLEWLVEHVANASYGGDLGDLGDLGVSIYELVMDWYGDVDRDDLPQRVRALRAMEEIATSSLEPSGELSESLGEAWGNVLPDGPLSSEQRLAVAEAVRAAVVGAPTDGDLADELDRWVSAVAPRMFPDVTDRLLWFADSVGRLAGDAPALPAKTVEALTGCVCEWLGELEKGPIEDLGAVLRTFRRTAMGACVAKVDLDESLEKLADALAGGSDA